MLIKSISNEVLVIGAKTPLVQICKDYVRKMREAWPDYPNNTKGFSYNTSQWKAPTEEFINLIRDKVGPKLSIDVFGGHNNFNMGVTSQIWFNGHSGSRWYASPQSKIAASNTVKINETLEVDLKNVTVKGELVDLLTFRLYYTEAVMFNSKMFTEDEVVGVMLHEFGHIFNTFMTLGDYVWLNYYLTDGIEILLNKKKNVLKLELLNEKAILENVPPEELERFMNERNEDNAKRVILSMIKHAPRHHLTHNELIANRREEQLADLFTSRLGYGRAFAMFEYKMNKYYGDACLTGTNWFAETAKILVFALTLPSAVMWAMFTDPLDGGRQGRYDDPMTRITKVRRDLVAQLKNPGPTNKDIIAADIEALDEILKEYVSHSDFYKNIVTFFQPSIRKQQQNTKVEDDLESLFHNDLFVQAFKLSKL